MSTSKNFEFRRWTSASKCLFTNVNSPFSALSAFKFFVFRGAIKIIHWHKYVSLLLVLGLVSCESEIDIILPPPETLVVVDGTIENGQFARVAVTKTTPYFDVINFASLAAIFITDATVILSDGVISDTLLPVFDATQFPPYFYQGDDPALIGQEWKTYYLTVYALGDTLTATTSIPGAVPVDSIRWSQFGNDDSLGLGGIFFKEPDSLGNFYHLLAKRQGYPYYVTVPFQGISNDQIGNGQYIDDFPFGRPDPVPGWFNTATGDTIPDESGIRWRRGDTIYTKLCSIDFYSYEFLRTYDDAASSFGNPFSAPTYVASNIKGGLGGFVGIGATYSMYIVP